MGAALDHHSQRHSNQYLPTTLFVVFEKTHLMMAVTPTFVFVIEVTEVNWTWDGDNFSQLGCWPAG